MKYLFYFLLLFSNISAAQVNLDLGLRAYYPFSGNADDVSGYHNDPVVRNAQLTTDRFGNAKSAYHFNGRNSYMRIRNNPSLNMKSKISIAAWIKPTGHYAGPCHGNAVVQKGDIDFGPGNYMIRFDDNQFTNGGNCSNPVDIMHQNFYGFNATVKPPGYTPYIQRDQWYSVVLTYDGTTAKLYVNCVLKFSGPQRGLLFTNDYDLYLGRFNNSGFPYWFDGDLDEVRIYDRALTPQEVETLCNRKNDSVQPITITKKEKPEPGKKEIAAKPKNKTKTEEARPVNIDLVKDEEITPFDARNLMMFNGQEVKLENRKDEMIREIPVDHDSVTVTLYDNGEIDGDSVTLIYNDSVLAIHKMLTDKPLSFTIKIVSGNRSNKLVMYAENLGSIPPNTALMVIYDGDKRYEVNMRSNLNSSGAISFKLRE